MTKASQPNHAGADAVQLDSIRDAARAFRETLKEAKVEKVYWYFSEKAGGYVQLRGDVAFVQTVIDEFDPTVATFSVEAPEAVTTVDGEPTGTRFDAKVNLRDGSVVFREYKRSEEMHDPSPRTQAQLKAQEAAAAAQGARYEIRTDVHVRRLVPRFWNCLVFLGWQNRSRGVVDVPSVTAFFDFTKERTCATLAELLSLEGADPAITLRTLSHEVARGAIKANLDSPLTRKSVFYWGINKIRGKITHKL
jgi:hypothetical protein